MQAADPLTGLADRRTFLDRLRTALKLEGGGAAVLLLDLDRFKAVNDTLGHQAGDALLRASARRLQTLLRSGDLAARLGGDEFAVLLESRHADSAAIVASRIVDVLSRPYMLGGQIATVGVSVGIALAAAGTDEDETLRRADLALYAAKAHGRGRHMFFEPALSEAAEARRSLEQDLRSALALGQLDLHYQPQVGLEGGDLTGFEALLRWRHPARGLVSPASFLPIAESIGLLPKLGEWVLRRATRDAVGWPTPLTVAVNVAPQQFDDGRLPNIVGAALAAAGLPASRLEIEITENALLRREEAVLSQLRAIQKTGVSISLDDFGTGYSSLTQLRSFDFDRVKIDRSFAADPPVVRAIAALGAALGMRTTLEGVETAAQLDMARHQGVSDAQGFLLSRPVAAGEVLSVVTRLREATPTTEIAMAEGAHA
jgi:diguanylate cyclase (GGDEF)-like protein